jgi:hypothetical protein
LNKPGAALLPYGLVAVTALMGWCIYWFVRMPEGVEVSRSTNSKTVDDDEQQQHGIVGSSCCYN